MTPSVKKRIREQKRPGRSHFSCTWQDRSVRLAAGTSARVQPGAVDLKGGVLLGGGKELFRSWKLQEAKPRSAQEFEVTVAVERFIQGAYFNWKVTEDIRQR